MPLPPAPTKRAALLSADALTTPVRALARPAKTRTAAESQVPVIKAQTEHPAARTEKRRPSPVKSLASTAPAPKPAPAAKIRQPKSTGPTKLFVLDTNVLMHDPMC